MQLKYTYLFLLLSSILFAQNTQNKNNRILEDHSGHLILNSEEKEKFLKKLETELQLNSKYQATQPAVYLCSNSNFEEFEVINGQNVLKNFLYTTQNPLNPTQCSTPTSIADQYITQYNPANTNLMATTVPSNFFDSFIGNIQAFDQFALKINYDNSSPTSGVVQAKRFKTNNESKVLFNFKAVLQSIPGAAHTNEQPFFKARIINKNGIVVDEFCLIGDPTNCIFTQDPSTNLGDIILYTKKWQSGILDITSIPNNEEFTIEFTAARCGLNGHFGYAYIDDLCVLHSQENLQGSIELDPLYKICPTFPLQVCGKFTVPNSGGVTANVNSIKLNVYDSTNSVVYSTTTTSSLDLTNNTFCFNLTAANFPNITNANYNIGAEISFTITNNSNCTGTNFSNAFDNDANPGSDISFLNCDATCDLDIRTATLKECDTNGDGKEIFNLNNSESQIIANTTGLTFSYFTNLNDATNNTNPIATPNNFLSYSTTVFVRVHKTNTCYKIIAIQLLVKNPKASISGILNVCNGSTVLTASPGVSYLWSNGDTTQATTITSNGTYTVSVTDNEGCISNASVTIIPTNVATSPQIETIQPTCFISTGTITILTPAAFYSFDDGITWITSNTLSNLTTGIYKIKIKTINNCISYTTNVTISPFLSSYPYYTSINPTSCDGKGSITITTVATAYSFDDGVTWTPNNTMNNLAMGIYKIRTKDANGCISNFNSVYLQGEFFQQPTYSVQNPYCSNLGSITINSNATYFSIDGGNTWQTSNIFNGITANSYVIKVKDNNGCTSPNLYAYINSFENSYPTYTKEEPGCAKYGKIEITTAGDFYSFDNGITWTTSNTLTNIIGGTSYTILVKKNNCITYSTTVYINAVYRALPIVSNHSALVCDNQNNGNENDDLSSYNNFLIANHTNYTFKYYKTLNGAINFISNDEITNFNQYNLSTTFTTIYVNVIDQYGCFSTAELKLELIKTPVPLLNNLYYLCEGKNVTLEELGVFDQYNWSTGETTSSITVNTPGTYTISVSEIHGNLICTTTKSVDVVLSNPPTSIHVSCEDWTDNDNTILITPTGLGNYEYSIDGIHYQDSNIFTHLPSGEFTVYVNDKNGCGRSTEDVFLLMYPKFFTPNGDGYNDHWKIKYSNEEPNLIIYIHDRSGKLLKQFSNDSQGWDGTYLGQPMPADDYWFTVTRANGKEYRAHFSLKR